MSKAPRLYLNKKSKILDIGSSRYELVKAERRYSGFPKLGLFEFRTRPCEVLSLVSSKTRIPGKAGILGFFCKPTGIYISACCGGNLTSVVPFPYVKMQARADLIHYVHILTASRVRAVLLFPTF